MKAKAAKAAHGRTATVWQRTVNDSTQPTTVLLLHLLSSKTCRALRATVAEQPVVASVP